MRPSRVGADDGRVQLSVVLPVLDGVALIGAQLDALLGQRWAPGFEVVVADNGSTDGTVALVRARAEQDDRLRLVTASTRGVAAARNAGIAAAHAAHIAICDADDVVGPDWVRAMGEALQANELVGGPLEYDLLNPAWAADVRGRSQESGFLVDGPGPRWPYPFGCNTGVRRQLWTAVGGYDETLKGGGDDNDFAWRVRLEQGVEPVWVPGAVVHYRCRQDLRGVYRQARGYGAGTVRLAQRYAEHWPEPPRPPGRGEAVARFCGSLVRRGPDRRALGRAVFHLGWQLGARSALDA